ncbi:MAG: UDP-N-acetylmuramate--L-alanine ligase [Candidatus Omnitrophica bacterium]|nr:UDP-N-acetylmuramate--L-alanine ligase [Candidatus Omnitrophota bacterium]
MEEVLHGIKNIYLVGIGGIGMSGLALLLKDKGFNVKGSDLAESYTVRMLQSDGIAVDIGHRRENITDGLDLLVHSSAVKENNPEIIEARNKKTRIIKRGELLGMLCSGQRTVAVSGSHGKTTTTALIGHLLTQLGHQPAVCVGGLPLNYSRNAWWGNDYFVIETDESDGSFLYCEPWVSVITNIDHEHLDYHKTIENLKESFLQFALHTHGKVFGCGDDASVRSILERVGGISYGFSPANMICARNFHFDGEFSCFDVTIAGTCIPDVKVPLLGEHNALNTLAVLGFFFHCGFDLSKVIEGLKTFKGTKRRFQIKERVAGVTFIDDYAHHPTEIGAVLKAARYLNPKRIVAIFQPHRFSRVKSLCKEFSGCFSLVDELIVTDIYSASEKNNEGIDVMFLLDEIKKQFPRKVYYVPKEKLVQEVPLCIEEGDFVLGLGAGDINIVMEGIVNEYKKNRVKTAR